MRITIPAMRAPICYCGNKMEICVDLCARKVRLECSYCGLEQSVFVPFDIGALPLNAVADIARSLME